MQSAPPSLASATSLGHICGHGCRKVSAAANATMSAHASKLGVEGQRRAYLGDAAGVVDGGGDDEAAAAVDDEGAVVVRHIGGGAKRRQQQHQQEARKGGEWGRGGGHGRS